VFSLQDDDEQWLSLRYDLTAPLARFVAENYEALPKPFRSYRAGYVFRNEKPGPGRFRQFMQFDADCVGAPGPSADAEMCMMMADAIEAAGIPRGDYVIRVNNRKVLDGAMEALGLGGDDKAGQRLAVLRSIDKLDKVGIEGVRQLLGEGRKDESGDFTKGAGLSLNSIDEILMLLCCIRTSNPGKLEYADFELTAGQYEEAILRSGLFDSIEHFASDESARSLLDLMVSPFNVNVKFSEVVHDLLIIFLLTKFSFIDLASLNASFLFEVTLTICFPIVFLTSFQFVLYY
jgi:histidyl-tRNA synthetase